MKYLKVYTNFKRSIKDLKDDEKGRLFDAMLTYAETGEEPTLTGNEMYLWGSVLNMFDAQNTYNEKQRSNGLKGGRPKTQQNPEKPNETQANPEKPKRKEKKKENNTPTEYLKESAFEIAMNEFREHRKSIKAPLNELSEKKIRNELERLTDGDEVKKIQILDQSIRNGWKGVFQLKDERPVRNYAEHHENNLDHLLVNLDEVMT